MTFNLGTHSEDMKERALRNKGQLLVLLRFDHIALRFVSPWPLGTARSWLFGTSVGVHSSEALVLIGQVAMRTVLPLAGSRFILRWARLGI